MSAMEPTSQLIRLSIPGSIFVLAGGATYAFAEVVWGGTLSEVEALTTLTTSITAIAASVPLGFLVYQIYYWRYSPYVIGDFVSRDRGRDALWHLDPEVLARLRTLFDARLDVRRHHRSVSTPVIRRLKLLRLNDGLLRARYKDPTLSVTEEDSYLFEKDNRNVRRIYADNWYENWDVFRALLDLLANEGKRPEIKQNFTALYDIYHSLGASRLAIILGSFAGLGYLGGTRRTDISEHVTASILGVLVVILVAFSIAYVLHRTRIATWKSAISKVRLDLTACLALDPPFLAQLPEPEKFTERRAMRRPSNQYSRPHRRPALRRLSTSVATLLLGDIGTLAWTQRTRGLLSRGEKMRYRAAVGIATLLEAPRTLIGRLRRRGLGPDPSDVELPQTDFAASIVELCSDLDPMVLEHGYRSYIFAKTLGVIEGIGCNDEALFAATMLHAYSFPRLADIDRQCFTAASLDFAVKVLEGAPFGEAERNDILDAVSRHLNPAVGPPLGKLQHLTHDGILLDMLGVRAWELDREGLDRVVKAHPRHGLTVKSDIDLSQHARQVPNGRVAALYGAGHGWALRFSRWWAWDRDAAIQPQDPPKDER
jgi:hypothetical protein